MENRLELLKKNRTLIQETLEHIQNVTNIGIKVKEDVYSISIALPNEIVSIPDEGSFRSYVRSGGQLIFTQDPKDGIKIRHKMPQVQKNEEPLTGEVVSSIPASAINREVILKKVIEFLEKVQAEKVQVDNKYAGK